MCYQGGKYKLLDKILLLFPSNYKTFIDLFARGFNVGINVKAEKIVYNDNNSPIMNLIQSLYLTKMTGEECAAEVDKIIKEYGLNKTDKEAYLKLRADYNSNFKDDWKCLYALITFCYSNYARFNRKNEFNQHFGERDFNGTLRKRFIRFVDELHKRDIDFLNVDFRQIEPNQGCFVYCDPPYSLTCATYNKDW